MFHVLATYLSDKLEYACCFRNFVYVSYAFYDIGVDTFNTQLFNYVFRYIISLSMLFIIMIFNIVLIY